MTEKVLDAENWKLEALAVVKDIENHVKSITVLNGTDQQIYFNLTTIEGNDFCIELSGSGFRVAGKSYNQKSDENEDFFETPYSLLDHVSPSFHKSFGNELLSKLTDLSNKNL
ncbi:hypothetical protein Zmor_014603 [Zophobas morio]|uniref:GSKIP domain-containing protein n=2 Tax=Zophobas morio TaxID=2755281 RepID=A0AA38IF08_9CUCU|nr:hypothetical protein Zmor_014603 [Zophobas morio]